MSSFSTDSPATAFSDADRPISDALRALLSTSEKMQMQTIQAVDPTDEAQLSLLMELVQHYQQQLGPQPSVAQLLQPSLPVGNAYHILLNSPATAAQEFLQAHVPHGIIPLRSERGIVYRTLQQQLAQQDFQAADQTTNQILCRLAGDGAVQRKWVYFTEVSQFPSLDLHILNALWLIHSEGKFGISVQRDIWLSVGKNWDKLWPKIDWKDGNSWTRYPKEFTWDLTAPRGHLPLSNQLRGVRMLAALFDHPAWSQNT